LIGKSAGGAPLQRGGYPARSGVIMRFRTAIPDELARRRATSARRLLRAQWCAPARLAAALVVPVPVELETVALVLDVGGVRRREVRRHQQRPLLHAIGQQRVTALAREVAVLAEAAVPFPQRHLHRIVQRVSGEDRALAARIEVDADLARRVAGCGLQ